MSRVKFISAFTDLRNVSGDTLEVRDFEGTSKCLFIFEMDKLIRIEIDNYID